MRVLSRYIIIEPVADEVTMDSGLVLSSDEANINARYRKAKVYLGGEETSIEAGALIYYDKSAGHSLMLEGRSVTVIRESDVVLVI